MKNPLIHTATLTAALACGAWFLSTAADPSTGTVMRDKLSHSQEILRAITMEDYDAMQTHAQKLNKLSYATGWFTRQTPEYELFTAELRRHTDALTKAARAKNIDAATLSYMQLTMSCVSCHKYIRGSKSASLPPGNAIGGGSALASAAP